MNIKEGSTTQEQESARSNGKAKPRVLSNNTRITNLVVGDVLVFLIFATIGRRSHGEENSLLYTFLVALPFLVAWFAVSPFIGAFKRGLEVNPRQMFVRTLLSWIAAWPIALILRGIFVDHQVPPPTFWIVSFISNFILLMLWRIPMAWVGRMRAESR